MTTVNLSTIATPPTTDLQSDPWLADLRASGQKRDAAVDRLRTYLLRAIWIYLTRQRSDLTGMHFEDLSQLAEDWAQESVMQVLGNLDRFRGDSRFTTWAYRVAINLVAGDLRRKRWDNSSLDAMTESETADLRPMQSDRSIAPESRVTRGLVWDAIQTAIRDDLTERQRTALTRVVLEGRPIEVVAGELETNRNNIYKLVHDARKKLRQATEERGWSADEILAAFAPPDSQ